MDHEYGRETQFFDPKQRKPFQGRQCSKCGHEQLRAGGILDDPGEWKDKPDGKSC